MKAAITSIKLKRPLKYFVLSSRALRIIQQLKATNYEGFKKKWLWTTLYNMTLRQSEDELKKFASSGVHK